MVQAGQCEIEAQRSALGTTGSPQENEGYAVADRAADGANPKAGSPGTEHKVDGLDILRVDDLAYDSIDSLLRALNFFATPQGSILRRLDDPPRRPANSSASSARPRSPHRLVNHDTAEVKTFTRMQVRILDHVPPCSKASASRPPRAATSRWPSRETEGTTTTP